MSEDLNARYAERIDTFAAGKKKLEAKSVRIAISRLILFIAAGIAVYLAVRLKSSWMLIPALLMLAGFLLLIRHAVTINNRIGFLQTLIRINKEELEALAGNYSAFDPGNEFIDFNHAYSYDLDIFGEHSVYRMINRTATPLGRKNLAVRLLDPGTDPGLIRERQTAVRELAGKLAWRHDFLATARESDWERHPDRQISAWLDAPDRFSHTWLYPAAIAINVFITCTLTVLYLLTAFFPLLLPFTIPPVAFVYFLLPIGLIISRTQIINREQQRLERLLDLFRKYAGLLQLIESENYSAPFLQDLKNRLTHNQLKASQIMKMLTGILWGLEVRGNLIVSFFLNSFFLWDIHLMIRLERWRRDYHDSFSHWITVIAEFETLNSLANLAFNRPDLSWPEIREGKFSMDIRNGGHPLIPPAKRVDNSLGFSDAGQIYLVTGANMAGKSTLLRMVGVNMVLAMAGGPVCAGRMTLVPVSIHTSVRTNDSLGDDESYFYAELKKLSCIIDRLERDERLFVIVDEMLKGTNSRDKHTGSAALIRRLVALGTSGLVATHDVELGELEKEYPGRLVNQCFEVVIDHDQLRFDYLLQQGVSRNLNATFLMRKMGIIRD